MQINIEQKRIFDDWLKNHKGLIFKVIRAYAFTTHDQDDLFQEITIQVWKSVPNFKGESAETTWIYRVALFSAIAWTRKEKKHKSGKEPINETELLHPLNNEPANPKLDWLYEQIAKLNDIDKSLTLLLLDGYSYKEMSDILGISESNVGVKINRIKKVLRKNHRRLTMEFEEMKKIWDSQSNKTYYGIDEEAMHKHVMKKNIEFKRMSEFGEWGLIIISLFLAGFMTLKGIANEQPEKFISTAIYLLVAVYLFVDRKKRILNDGFSDKTVLGDLEQAIRTIDYYIHKSRNMIWWFMLPAAISMIINISFYSEDAIWRVSLSIGAIVLALLVVHFSLKYSVLPKKEKLESIRKTLLDMK